MILMHCRDGQGTFDTSYCTSLSSTFQKGYGRSDGPNGETLAIPGFLAEAVFAYIEEKIA